jgi:hypothetical protein
VARPVIRGNPDQAGGRSPPGPGEDHGSVRLLPGPAFEAATSRYNAREFRGSATPRARWANTGIASPAPGTGPYEQPLVVPHELHTKQDPAGCMAIPQV